MTSELGITVSCIGINLNPRNVYITQSYTSISSSHPGLFHYWCTSVCVCPSSGALVLVCHSVDVRFHAVSDGVLRSSTPPTVPCLRGCVGVLPWLGGPWKRNLTVRGLVESLSSTDNSGVKHSTHFVGALRLCPKK